MSTEGITTIVLLLAYALAEDLKMKTVSAVAFACALVVSALMVADLVRLAIGWLE